MVFEHTWTFKAFVSILRQKCKTNICDQLTVKNIKVEFYIPNFIFSLSLEM
jgi:hypothetical protein